MMRCLAWKEFREHRSIWLAMVVMTGLLGMGLGQLAAMDNQNPAGTIGLTVLAMAAVYGVVCGSMMFAGEKEGGTLVLLDIFLGRRGQLWTGKLLVGIPLIVTEALAVALTLFLLKQPPPEWMASVVGYSGRHWIDFNPQGTGPPTVLWFLALPLVTLEAYAWGLLGSSMTRRVLTSAGLALVMGFHVWMITLAPPPPASLGLRFIVFGMVLFGSCAIFMSQTRDTPLGPPVAREDPKTFVLRQIEREMHLEQRVSEQFWQERVVGDLPIPVAETKPKPKRRGRAADADSPRQVLMWLTFQQASVVLICLAATSVVVGIAMPPLGQALWPIATLLLGVACGTATFAWEQSDQSYQFLAAQHFPLRTVWRVKTLFWLAAAAGTALLWLIMAGVLVGLGSIAALQRGGGAGGPWESFHFGTLAEVLGPVLFFGMWLAYGFCFGQVFVLLCRKPIYAVIIAGMVTFGAVALWLPSLLGRGMSGWQVWVVPVAALVATRLLIRPWAAGRVADRRPLTAMMGVGAAALVWVAVNYGYRAWEIADVGEPLDRKAFRASIPSGNENPAAQKIQEALAELEKDNQKAWLALMAEVSRLPAGVIVGPPEEGSVGLLRHLPGCAEMTAKLRVLARATAAQGKSQAAFDQLGYILALSRNLRNKAPLQSYHAGIGAEHNALEGVDVWLTQIKPTAEVLQHALDELNRHATETPPPLDCLRTECYRSGGTLQYPSLWSFYSGPGGRGGGTVPERWLCGWITLSLDMPWESERKTRLWRTVWAGEFRALQTPYWLLPPSGDAVRARTDATRRILHGWLPAAEGPGASMTTPQLARLLDESWLSDETLFAPVVPLRAAATRARWRLDASRLAVALGLYQFREGKTAQKLDDLVPKYLPELPVDPYSGGAYGYRISAGEELDLAEGEEVFQGRNDGKRGQVRQGQAILWSTGPDRADDGGRSHGGSLPDDHTVWRGGGSDLLTVVPHWR